MRLLLSLFLLLLHFACLAQNNDCQALISASSFGCEANFTGSALTGADVTSYSWNFGDGQRSFEESPNHTYAQNGTYTVELSITTSDSCTVSSTYDLTISGCQECSANFAATVNGCDVLFYDQSIAFDGISSWSWSFGDGGSSTDQNPSYSYGANGSYQVYLDILTPDGCSSTFSKEIVVSSCSTECSADFSYSQSSDCSISFYPYQTGPQSANQTYYWDFGDGNTSSDYSPSHSYDENGTYAVSLTISGDSCSDTFTQNISVSTCSTYCQADFSYSETGDCALYFYDASSSSSGISSWYWDFGDGTTSSEYSPTHSYTENGTYTVSLTISGENCSDTYSYGITVSSCSTYCEASFSYIQLDSCSISFYESSYSSSDSINYWYWDFGDGNNSLEQNPSHQYAEAGMYTVSLTIGGDQHCQTSTSQTLNIESCSTYYECEVDFSYGVSDSCEYVFSSYSYSPNGNITSWYWDFGDGITSEEENPIHYFSQPGVYEVILTISGSDGCQAEMSQRVYVDSCGVNETYCEANFGYDWGHNCAIYFVDYSYSSSGIIAWHWDFGDGHFSSDQNPIHSYVENGNYAVSLIIESNDDCLDTLQKTIYVGNCTGDCYADFSYFLEEDCTVEFTDMSSGPDSVIDWDWDFGDGHIGGGSNPTHLFSGNGTYKVQLIITTAGGCMDTVEQDVIVSGCGNECYADFSYFQNPNCELEFTDLSSVTDSIIDWDWDFGDGHIGGGPNPTHIFPHNGSYRVQLLIETQSGCKDTVEQEVILTDCGHACYADFSYFQNPNCEVEFTDLSSLTDSIIDWDWDFGDGHIGGGSNPTHIFPQNGTYRVQLIIETKSGCKDTVEQDVILTDCGNECQADFSYFQNPDCEVEFTDLSSFTDSIIDWDWDFGDGHFSGEQNPTHIFPRNGTYRVQLIIETKSGCKDTVEQEVILTDCGHECYADFSYFTTDDCKIEFSDRSSSEDSILNWYWAFGDGHNSREPNPDHQYTANGEYEVELIIQTRYCSDTISQKLHISGCEKECRANFFYEISGTMVYFKDLSEWDVISWKWEFGDGHSSTQTNPIHKYAQIGEYEVVLEIETREGCIDRITRKLLINDCIQECKADFAYRAISDCSYEFEDFSRSNLGDVMLWTWNFGDGSTGSGSKPTHTYIADGDYLVELSILTTEGCSSKKSHVISVRNCQSQELCSADFEVEKDSLDVFTYHFEAKAVGNELKYEWDFGDGNQSGLRNPSHTYESIGPFEVNLTIIDGTCVALDSAMINITTKILDDLLATPVLLYPNPTNSSFQVEAEFKEALSLAWEIVDLRGQRVLHQTLKNRQVQMKETIDISKLALGVYFFHLRTEDGLLHREKIMKR